jgi:threonine aldolase
VDAECKSLISICFSKIAGAPIGSVKFWGSKKEESMACALRRYGVTDSGSSVQKESLF